MSEKINVFSDGTSSKFKQFNSYSPICRNWKIHSVSRSNDTSSQHLTLKVLSIVSVALLSELFGLTGFLRKITLIFYVAVDLSVAVATPCSSNIFLDTNYEIYTDHDQLDCFWNEVTKATNAIATTSILCIIFRHAEGKIFLFQMFRMTR